MSNHNEFEKSDSWDDYAYSSAWDDAQDCYVDGKTQHDYQLWLDGYQTCADKNKEIIDRQAKEIEALRGFANSNIEKWK